MTDSILDTIKKMLGIPSTDTSFDTDVIVAINSSFMTLQQLGVGPAEVYSIEDNSNTWIDFLTDSVMYSAVKSFIYLSVKLMFDPPPLSYVIDAYKSQLEEVTWRLSVQVPVPPSPPPVVPEEP